MGQPVLRKPDDYYFYQLYADFILRCGIFCSEHSLHLRDADRYRVSGPCLSLSLFTTLAEFLGLNFRQIYMYFMVWRYQKLLERRVEYGRQFIHPCSLFTKLSQPYSDLHHLKVFLRTFVLATFFPWTRFVALFLSLSLSLDNALRPLRDIDDFGVHSLTYDRVE
jgi:hypothetical protein